MSLTLVAILVVLGGIGGFAAGFLGVGGGVLLFPLPLYIPLLLGLENLDAKTVAALVISQVFFATLIGGSAHWRHGRDMAGLLWCSHSRRGGLLRRWSRLQMGVGGYLRVFFATPTPL